MTSFVQLLANLKIKRNFTSVFVNRKRRYFNVRMYRENIFASPNEGSFSYSKPLTGFLEYKSGCS